MADTDLSKTQEVLTSIPALSGLAAGELEALCKYMQSESYPAGGAIFSEGEQGDKLYIITSGLVNIVKKGMDEFSGTVELAHRVPGEIIGEMAIIDDSPRFATAVCAEPTEVAVMSRESFNQLVQSQPELALRIIKIMTARLKEADITRLRQLEEKNIKLEDSATQLHHALKELQSANRQFEEALRFRQRLLDVSPSPVVVTNAEMIVQYCNPAVYSVFGIEPSSYVGSGVDELLGCQTREEGDEIATSLLEQGRWDGEVEVCTKDDRHVYCRVAAVPVPSEENHADTFLFIFHDETEIRELQQQAAERERLASKGEMAAEIAHELNNYLAVLSGNLELLSMFLESGNAERTDKCLKTLELSLGRMRVFTMAMLSSRPPQQEKIVQNINRFLENQVAFLKPQRSFKKSVITTNFAEGLPEFEFDPNALQQVLYNLVLNSAEALASTANPEPSIAIATRRSVESGNVVLEVSDNGPGIDPSIMKQLFQKRVTTKSSGHGIGMMTVKRIIDEHGGTVTGGTAPGGGAVFTIELPLRVEESQEVTAKIPARTNH